MVGLLALVALPLSGVISVHEAFTGFSDPNIILIAALFVIGDGLVRTGIAKKLGDWLVLRAGNHETRLIALLMLIVALLGSVMSSTGVVAIFIPVVLRIAQRTQIAPGRLMMPLSFAGLLSGMLTLVATAPNLIVDAELTRAGLAGFEFFSFTPFGVPILALGIGYMLIARRWLPRQSGTIAKTERPTLHDFANRYHLHERQFLMKVEPGSQLIGRTLGQIGLRNQYLTAISAISKKSRSGQVLSSPSANTVIETGDILLVETLDSSIDREDLQTDLGLTHHTDEAFTLAGSHEVGMAEVLIRPESDLIGRNILQSSFRSRFRTTVIGLRRNLQAFDHGFSEEKLQVGDTLLLIGTWKEIRNLHANSRDFLVLNLPAEMDEITPVQNRAPQALFSLGLMIFLMISGLVPNVIAALIGCLSMGLFRCISMESSYRSIHWQSLILIIGMLPFAIALEKTGGITLAVKAISAVTGSAGNHVLLACIFILTATIGLFVSNTATAVLMAPVAISSALQMGVSPYPFAMMVALGASTAFMTPVSSPVNILVSEPGQYRFSHFVKIGTPFAFIVLGAALVLVPWLLPFLP